MYTVKNISETVEDILKIPTDLNSALQGLLLKNIEPTQCTVRKTKNTKIQISLHW
jgi:hypothetical protein